MASSIPTRRTTRRADENAAPVAGRVKAATTMSTTVAPAAKVAALRSGIPVLKRTHSAATGAGAVPGPTKSAVSGAVTARSALGEVTNGGKEDAKGLKSKAGGEKGKVEGVREKRALALQTSSQQMTQSDRGVLAPITRRTRSSGAADPIPSAETAKPAVKRRTTSRIPVATASTAATGGRSRSNTSSTTAAETRLRERKLNVAIEAKSTTELEPARKKRKTSSPAAEEVLVISDDEDLADEGLYDDDGREVVLSSGGRGTRLRSPERAVRAKDYGWTDLDAEDDGDPTMVSEYVVDAFNYMMSIEDLSMPDPHYMNRQAELSWTMRLMLMDWLIEVHSKFRLLPETLLIAVNLVDRFLTARVVSLQKLQLVGMTALFVAAKYEEVICPSISHFLHMADGGFDLSGMLKAERYLLSTLDFDLSYPNPLHFLRRISKADGYDIQTRTLAKYLVEVMCVERRLLPFKPSLLAAAGMWLSRLCLDRGDWNANLIHYSTYTVPDLLRPAQIMVNFVVDPETSTDSAFFKKYAGKKHMKSSVYIRQWAINRWPESARGEGKYLGKELLAEIEGKLEPVTEVLI